MRLRNLRPTGSKLSQVKWTQFKVLVETLWLHIMSIILSQDEKRKGKERELWSHDELLNYLRIGFNGINMLLFWSVPINFCLRLRCRFIAWFSFFFSSSYWLILHKNIGPWGKRKKKNQQFGKCWYFYQTVMPETSSFTNKDTKKKNYKKPSLQNIQVW